MSMASSTFLTRYLARGVKKMLKCPNCGGEVEEDYKFCKFCGYKLTPKSEGSTEDVIKNIVIQRIEALKNRDAKAITSLVYAEKYTKFDDWPPFDLQDSNALRSEADALKVLKEYDYETRGWRVETFGDLALATFIIRYKGRIRDLDFNVQSRVTEVLLKHGDAWKIIHEHWSRFPARK